MGAPERPRCVEEELGPALFLARRKREGWRPVFLYSRGPGNPIGLISPLLTLLGLWLWNRPPRRLADLDRTHVLGSLVLGYESLLGSYGMGGPAYAGIKLRPAKGPPFFIVFTVWAATSRLILDGVPVGQGNRLANLIGSKLEDVILEPDSVVLTFSNKAGVLRLTRDPAATEEPSDLRDLVVVSRRAWIWLGR